MANDLHLRLDGEMARKMGIHVPADASLADTSPIEPDTGSKKNTTLPQKQSAKSVAPKQVEDALWDGLPDAATMGACKVLVSVRFDTEILDFFKESGSGYQTRMNAVLLHYVRACRARS